MFAIAFFDSFPILIVSFLLACFVIWTIDVAKEWIQEETDRGNVLFSPVESKWLIVFHPGVVLCVLVYLMFNMPLIL